MHGGVAIHQCVAGKQDGMPIRHMRVYKPARTCCKRAQAHARERRGGQLASQAQQRNVAVATRNTAKSGTPAPPVTRATHAQSARASSPGMVQPSGAQRATAEHDQQAHR